MHKSASLLLASLTLISTPSSFSFADDKVRIISYGPSLEYTGESSQAEVISCDDGCTGLVDTATLRKNLAGTIEPLLKALPSVRTEGVQLELEEMEISLEVDVKGGVAFIGRLETGASGGIRLKFKKTN